MNVADRNFSNQSFGSLASFQSVVDERLIRGPRVSCPWRLYQMKNEGVNQIIDLRNCSYFKKPMEKFFCKLLGIKYVNYKYSHKDVNLPSDEFFKRVNDTILQNDGKTYIHCMKGKRRTGLCVALYEKFHTDKSDILIIEDMLEKGFQEVNGTKETRRIGEIRTIYANFVEKYFPNLIG
ncbi:MAG: tyrosine-protein phosphatase [Fusobacterium sp.]|nr:tyrosine-protein phosphatase [Fusobacterium sp.]